MQEAISADTETETPPQLHGDGVTDDTEAIAWYFAHGVPVPTGLSYRIDAERIKDYLPSDFSGVGYVVR